MTTIALAQPGRCYVEGYDWFDCDIAADGGGITFDLPDGKTFALAIYEPGLGQGFLTDPESDRILPNDLGEFRQVEAGPACWRGEREIELFCALVKRTL